MILAWVGIGGALLLLGGLDRRTLGEHGPLARGARRATGVLLAIGAAGGFQMILHNSGMSVVVAERVAALGPLVGPAFGLALPVLIAATSRALQGSPLTAAIAAAGIMQPLLAPLGLAGDEGRALAAIAVGVGAMAVPHVNDGYFWLAGHLAGLRPAQGLKRVTGGAVLQAAAALATLLVLAALVRP
jgi:H+/gluconate symporter-like permease